MTKWAALAGLCLLMLGLLEVALLRGLSRRRQLEARLLSIRTRADMGGSTARSGTSFSRLVSAFGSWVTSSGLLSTKTLAGLNHTLGTSGLRGSGMLGMFVGAKLILLVTLPLLTLGWLHGHDLSPLIRNVCLAGAAMVGMLGPDWWIRRRHRQHRNALLLGLPDALDLMVICAEAGLGFEPAISRVASEIVDAHPAISDEFGQTASELRVVADSRIALINMGVRTELDSVKRMASMLVQTMRYGTPLGDALRVLSAEMRQETLIRFETRAARLPVLLTIPMILFILPTIFLIVGGPALIQVLSSFNQGAK